MWLGAKYPQRVKSLSLHSGWTKSDPFLKAVVEGWQTIAKGNDRIRLADESIERLLWPTAHECCELVNVFRLGGVFCQGLGNVTEMIIQGIFPWCFTGLKRNQCNAPRELLFDLVYQ